MPRLLPYMPRRIGTRATFSLTVLACLTLVISQGPNHSLTASPRAAFAALVGNHAALAGSLPPRTQSLLDDIPMLFEQLPSETGGDVRFAAHAGEYGVYLTNTDAVLTVAASSPRQSIQTQPLATTVIRIHNIGTNGGAVPVGRDRQTTTANYFLGNNSQSRQTALPTFTTVVYPDLYPGTDLTYYGTRGDLEYDYTIMPGANPAIIRLALSGVAPLALDKHGDLMLVTPHGTIAQEPPHVYQTVRGHRVDVSSHYALLGRTSFGFTIGAYDHRVPLVIDPSVRSVSLFGSNTTIVALKLDQAGNMDFAGVSSTVLLTSTVSLNTNVPATLPALRQPLPNAPTDTPNYTANYLTQLNAKGNHLNFSVYLNAGSFITGMTVDSHGSVYVVGYSNDAAFPTTINKSDTRSKNAGGYDAFLMKFTQKGVLQYSTLIGGTTDNTSSGGDDIGYGVAVDRAGNAYITGSTHSYNLPAPHGIAARLGYGKGSLGSQVDAFVAKFSPDFSRIIYSSYLGGSGTDSASAIALDPSGDAYIVGQTSSPDFPVPQNTHTLQQTLPASGTADFVVKLNPGGTKILYATYLGQSAADIIHGMAVDSAGNVYLAGETNGGMPQTGAVEAALPNANTHAFITELSAKGVLVHSTYLAGSGADIAYAMTIDGQGNVYLAGDTSSTDFVTPAFPLKSATQSEIGGNRGGFGMLDAFVAKVNTCANQLLYSSYLGGTFTDVASAIALDGHGNVTVGGATQSPNFPLSSNAKGLSSMPTGSVYRFSIDGNGNRVGLNNAFIARISSVPQPPRTKCPLPLITTLSTMQISLAATVPLTVTLRTAPLAHIDISLAVQNTVAPPLPVPTATPDPAIKGHKKPVKVKPVHYPKIGEIIYRFHKTATADPYGFSILGIHPKYPLTAVSPATLTIKVTGSGAPVTRTIPVTVGP